MAMIEELGRRIERNRLAATAHTQSFWAPI